MFGILGRIENKINADTERRFLIRKAIIKIIYICTYEQYFIMAIKNKTLLQGIFTIKKVRKKNLTGN